MLIAAPLRQLQRHAGDRVLRLEREDEQPLLLELVAQTGFAVGDVDAFDDLAVGRREPAAKFHRNCQLIVSNLSARSPLERLDRARRAKGWVGLRGIC